MQKNNAKTNQFSDSNFNTLVELGTTQNENYPDEAGLTVYGTGTDGTNETALLGRAKRKLVTQRTILELIKVVEEKGEHERKQMYWNAYHCQSNLIKSGDRIYTPYCKTRYCTTCLSIRKAKTINDYLPVIIKWKDPFFVTLTVTAVTEDKLKKRIEEVNRIFNMIKEKYRKRHQRGKGIKFIGIRSLECNFNPQDKTYNPHLHLIVPNIKMADILMVEWQRYWNRKSDWNKEGKKLARPFAQDRRRIKTDRVLDCIEIIKYGTKFITEFDVKNKKKNKKNKNKLPPKIYAAALDNIFCALKRKRLFNSFGFRLPKKPKKTKTKTEEVLQWEYWIYDNTANDWVNEDTGEALTGYVPPARLFGLLNDIDRELH